MSEENLDNEFLEEFPNKKKKSSIGLALFTIVVLFIMGFTSLLPIFYLYSVDTMSYLSVGFFTSIYVLCITVSILAGICGFTEIKIHSLTEIIDKQKATKEKHKVKKALVTFLPMIPVASLFCFGVAIGNITLSDFKKDYNSTSRIYNVPPLDSYKPIVHKVSDYNFTSRSKILTPDDDILFHKKIEDELLGAPRISENLDASLFSKSHRIQKPESETQPINININLNINIPGIDVIEQKIPLEIDPSLNKDVEINVTKPVVEKSIRELMNEQVISHGNDQTDDIHFEAIQNQIKNDLDLKRDYILRKEMLQHELDEMKHRNESLEDIKKEVMPYLFKAPQDNRFGDR